MPMHGALNGSSETGFGLGVSQALAFALGLLVVAGCSDSEAPKGKQAGDGCQGCTLEQPVQVALEGPVAVVNDGDGALRVRVDDAIAVQGPVEVTGAVAVTLPDEPVRCVVEEQPGAVRVVRQGAGFRGATQTVRRGDAGLGTLNADCHAAFAGSRICTDQEILFNSFPVPTLQADAWIFVRSVGGGHSGIETTQSITGRLWNGATLSNQNCRLFQTAAQQTSGIVFTAAGSLGNATCDQERPVACCGL